MIVDYLIVVLSVVSQGQNVKVASNVSQFDFATEENLASCSGKGSNRGH